jgi:hypothetical protein
VCARKWKALTRSGRQDVDRKFDAALLAPVPAARKRSVVRPIKA